MDPVAGSLNTEPEYGPFSASRYAIRRMLRLMTKAKTAKEHYAKARELRRLSLRLGDAKMKQDATLLAIEHEAIAEELERLETDEI